MKKFLLLTFGVMFLAFTLAMARSGVLRHTVSNKACVTTSYVLLPEMTVNSLATIKDESIGNSEPPVPDIVVNNNTITNTLSAAPDGKIVLKKPKAVNLDVAINNDAGITHMVLKKPQALYATMITNGKNKAAAKMEREILKKPIAINVIGIGTVFSLVT